MNERVHACLDGTLGRDELTPAERIELDRLEATVAAAAGELRARTPPDLAAGVMARIATLPPRGVRPVPWPPRQSVVGRAVAALVRPHTVTLRFRPAFALAAAAAAAALLLTWPAGDRPAASDEAARAAAEAAAPPFYVQFRVQVGEASRVALAGSFTDWEPRIELAETEPGLWSTLVPLPAGVHDYVFIVDGERWFADPFAPQVADGFGGVNSRLSLLPPSVSL